MTTETGATLAPISAPVLQAGNTEGHGSKCVRCKIPLERSWTKPQCGACKRELAAMHAACEYTMFRKTYYTCSTEGASLVWLLANGYSKDIVLPQLRSTSGVQALVNSS